MRAVIVGVVVASSLRVEAAPVAAVRRDIERRVDEAPKQRLSKAQLRPRMKVVMRKVERCYRDALRADPTTSGVVNTALVIRSEPKLGISLTVTGFETDGPLGESKPFLACVKTTLEAEVLPAVPALGQIAVVYPLTFDPGGRARPDDAAIVDGVVQAAKEGRCAEAVAAAARGLKRSWLAGTYRHTLIETAGTCACRLKDEPIARHYFSLASPELEDAMIGACRTAGIQLLD